MRTQPDRNAVRTGFSLIELSIVLVIIALLTGGILSMRSFVANAQLTNLMNESKFYISAFNQFQTHYNAPPGDYPTASLNWTGAGNGNGDGVVGVGNAVEFYYAFQHLAFAGFIEGKYSGVANAFGGATRGVNVPAASMDNVAFFYVHPTAMDGFASGDPTFPDGSYGNTLDVAAVAANSTGGPILGFLTPQQMAKVDAKFDDGMPNTGGIIVPKTAANCVAAGLYNTTVQQEKYCSYFMNMQ